MDPLRDAATILTQGALAADPAVGWQAFADLRFLGSQAAILVISVVLAATIAYHPITRRRATTIAAFDQPKTYLMYSMVGALVAIIVKVQPSMALVVFGIGGLLRFRTDVGHATDTGRVILVTVVGLCCGLELFVVAALATVFGWVLVWVVEGGGARKLVVQGITGGALAGVAARHASILRETGCTVLAQQQHVGKGKLVMVFRAPAGWDRSAFEARVAELPEAERGLLELHSA